jgi:hypothetical protein
MDENLENVEVVEPKKVDILEDVVELQNYVSLPKQGGDTVDSMIKLMMLFKENTSFGIVKNKVSDVLHLKGRNRLILGDWEDDKSDEIDYSSGGNDAITVLFINSLNDFTRLLESEVERNYKSNINKLKSLVAKFISLNLYYDYEDLYRPKEFENLIEDYVSYPENFEDFYKKAYSEIESINPESVILPRLMRDRNLVFLMENANISDYEMLSPAESNKFKELKKEYKSIIKPKLEDIQPVIGFNHRDTYNENIRKVLQRLTTYLNDPELVDKLNKVI